MRGSLPGSSDASFARASGLEDGPAFHALDPLVHALFSLLPLGTVSMRYALGSCVLLGALSVLVFELAQRAMPNLSRAKAPLALLLALTFAVSPPVQLEAQIPGGALLGTTLVLGFCFALTSTEVPISLVTLLGGLAFCQEPILGLMCCAALLLSPLPYNLQAHDPSTSPSARAMGAWAQNKVPALLGLTAGLLPLLVRVMATYVGGRERVTLGPILGDDALVTRHSIMVFVRNEVGLIVLALALVGLMVLWRAQKRMLMLYGALLVLSALALYWGAPFGPLRFGATALVLLSTLFILAYCTIFAGIDRIFHAPIPFAKASGILSLLFLTAIPLRMLDESDSRLNAYRTDVTSTWEDLAFDALPAKALVLVRDRRLWTRTQAASAAGTLRSDLSIVPTTALDSRAGAEVLLREPALGPLLRDILLGGAPTELTLSTLAQTRPVCVEFAHTWSQSLSKHLLPVGLFMQYEAEPRGLSERKIALDNQVVLRDRLARALTHDADPELAQLTIRALRLRAISTALTGERASTVRALEDLRVFAPNDAILEELVKRAVVSKGFIETSDLDPNK